jgi:hypothetical protein
LIAFISPIEARYRSGAGFAIGIRSRLSCNPGPRLHRLIGGNTAHTETIDQVSDFGIDVEQVLIADLRKAANGRDNRPPSAGIFKR